MCSVHLRKFLQTESEVSYRGDETEGFGCSAYDGVSGPQNIRIPWESRTQKSERIKPNEKEVTCPRSVSWHSYLCFAFKTM